MHYYILFMISFLGNGITNFHRKHNILRPTVTNEYIYIMTSATPNPEFAVPAIDIIIDKYTETPH